VEILRVDGPEAQSSLINRLAESFAGDERILSCWLHGSFATGTTDKYSDIDMALLVDDEQFHYVFQSVHETASAAGQPLVAWDSPKDVDGAGFTLFYADCNFLDVKVYRASRLPYLGGKSGTKIIFDRTGSLSFNETPLQSDSYIGAPVHEQIWTKMVYLCICAYSTIRFIKRENYWYASGMISAIRGTMAQIFWLWEHPDELADMSFIVWGVVRRDLKPELASELASTVSDAEKAEMVHTLGRLLGILERHGERIAHDTGSEYPGPLVDVVVGYYRRECT
jgi:hypothetical protein